MTMGPGGVGRSVTERSETGPDGVRRVFRQTTTHNRDGTQDTQTEEFTVPPPGHRAAPTRQISAGRR